MQNHFTLPQANRQSPPLIEQMETRLLLSGSSSTTAALQQWITEYAAQLPNAPAASIASLMHKHAKVKIKKVHIDNGHGHDKLNHEDKAKHDDETKSKDKGKEKDDDNQDDGDGGNGNTSGSDGTTNTGGHPTSGSVSITGNGQTIANGDTTPSTIDGTDFGSIAFAQDGPVRTFTFTNNAGSSIDITVITVPTGFVLVHPPQPTLAPHTQTTFSIQLDNSTVGTKTGKVSIATSSTAGNPIVFTITGAVTAA